jgi:hypothetical protein
MGNTNKLYVRLHIFFVHLFLQRFSQHVSVVYDHRRVVFTCTLTSVFLLFLHTLDYVYDKINWTIKTAKIIKIIENIFVYYYCTSETLAQLYPSTHSYTLVISHVGKY